MAVDLAAAAPGVPGASTADFDDESGATLDRLEASSRRLLAIKAEERAEKERRDGLICDARDENKSWRSIARAGRISIARACAIVGGGA